MLYTEINKSTKALINLNKSSSKSIHLSGGSKYKITIIYFHSIHDNINEDGDTYIKLYWSSDEIDEIIIPKKYFYSNNSFPPLKITDYNTKEAIIRKLYDNDLAFKNSDTLLLQDIPTEYLGATTLKFNSRIKTKSLKFKLNSPTFLYAAYFSHYPKPLSSDFEIIQ